MKKINLRRRFLSPATLLVCCMTICGVGLAQSQSAQSASQTETIVGNANKVEIIHKDGSASEVPKERLILLNKSNATARAAKPAPQAEEKPAEAKSQETAAKAGEGKGTKGAKETAPPPKARSAKRGAPTAAERAAKEKAEAVKRDDIQKLRAYEAEGGWFYDKDSKPLSQEELDKRIEAGDVAGIKAVDVRLQEWKTRTKPQTTDEMK